MRRNAAAATQKSVNFLRPRVHQAWCNLRAWLPFFDTPNRRARQVRYSPNDCRTGLFWDVALPRQCCRCAATDGLKSQEFKQSIRVFDYPLHIAGIAALMSGGILFLAFVTFSLLSYTILFSLLAIAGFIVAVASVLLFLKSWVEDVRLRLFACAEHTDELQPPDLVVHDNELTVVLPSESLAEAAAAELKQQRRGKRAAGESSGSYRSASSAPGAPPAAIPVNQPPLPPRPMVPDLPPIKLAGDDDDPLP